MDGKEMKQKECIHECYDCFGVGVIGCDDHEGDVFDEDCADCIEECRKCEACDDGDVVWCPFGELDGVDFYDCEKCDRTDVETALFELNGKEKYICESCYVDAHNSWHEEGPQLRWDKP